MGGPGGQDAFVGPHRTVSTTFDDRETAASRRLCAAVCSVLAPNARRILDVGCGAGDILEELHGLYPEADLVGIDPVPEAIDTAQARLPEQVTLIRTTAEALGDEHLDPFDLALCHLNLALWDDPVRGILAVLRSLDSGGTFYIVDLARVDDDERDRLLERATSPSEQAYLAAQIDCSLTPEQGRELLDDVLGSAEMPVTGRFGVGGLAGHDYASEPAMALWSDPRVQRAVAGFAGPEDGARATDVLHWEFHRG